MKGMCKEMNSGEMCMQGMDAIFGGKQSTGDDKEIKDSRWREQPFLYNPSLIFQSTY